MTNVLCTPRQIADNLRGYLRSLDGAQHSLVVRAIAEVVLGEDPDEAFFRELDRRIAEKDSDLWVWAGERWGERACRMKELVYGGKR